MRSKLLRALAHIKAAHYHIAEAGFLINRCYAGDLERVAIDPITAALNAANEKVGARYANAVICNLSPARLPK